MKRITFVIVALLPTFMFAANAHAQLDRFQGTWQNTDAQTRAIVKIIIDGTEVQVYGACRPNPCDWGKTNATAYGPNVSANVKGTATALLAFYKTAFSESALIIKLLEANYLEIETYTRFTDQSRRSAYTTRESFRRSQLQGMLNSPMPSSAQTSAARPANTGSRRIQNIAPEEMWKRVAQCVFPTYPGLAFDSRIAGTVDIGLGISPEGDVTDTSRVLDGPPLLAPSAVDAIRQWKFRPNMVQGEVTWSRVRALVRFNADGTTAVDLAPAILADNFGDPGTPRSVAAAFPRPATSPECKSVQPWTGAEGQQLPTFKTPEDVAAFTQTYYLRPRPELIAGVIDALHSTGFLQRATAAPPIIGFFSEVFAANPNRLPQWQVLIGKQDVQTKAALERALSVSKAGGVRSIEGHSSELNDEYWGAFFASGNPDFLKKLVDQLHYVDERNDFYLFMTGVSAKWSLASNAQSHILVRSTLETAKLNADRRTQELISELLAQGPARVKQEASEIIRKQREAGKWAPQTGVPSSPPPVPLVEAALSRLIDLTPESTSRTSMNVADGKAEASRCVQATRLASTYSSRVLYKVTNGKPADIEWRVDFSAPDKYHVLQSSGQVFDEWITIGKENYSNVGLVWLTLDLGQPELNRFFGVDKFLHILATAEPTSAIEYVSREARYLLLEYRAQLGKDFNFTATEPGQVRIWIDRQTNLLVKGEVTARDNAHGTLSKLYLQQVFSGYGEAIRIEPPPSSVLGTNKK